MQVGVTEERQAVLTETRRSAQLITYVDARKPIIQAVAHSDGIGAWDLTLQLLLHVPRLVVNGSFPDDVVFVREAERLGRIVAFRQHPYDDLQRPPLHPIKSPHDLETAWIDEEEACIIHERFHYLASFRENSLHFGLRMKDDKRVVALLSLSPYDLGHLTPKLPDAVAASEVAVLSRVYSFDWAPRNTLSYAMGQLFKAVRGDQHRLKMILTYLNPNVGFGGASYRAANWTLFGREWGTHYAYLDGNYVTDRSLRQCYGTSDAAPLRLLLGSRFKTNGMELDPLLLYAFVLDRHLAREHPADFDIDVRLP